MNIFEKIIYYFTNFPFVRYALIVTVLIALVSALLGITLVLKRFSYIGDGLSHVGFGAMAIATIINLTNDLLIVLPVTILCAILLLKSSKNVKIKGDALISMVSVGALAFGYLLLNIFPSSGNLSGDICTTLFGSTSILTLSARDMIICVILCVITLICYVVFYNSIFLVTFDEDYAKSIGINTNIYNIILATFIAVIVVLAMNLVGTLLISALVIFPALSAMRICKSYKKVVIASAIISILSSSIGLISSIAFNTPVGATIVVLDVIIFLVFYLIGLIRSKVSA